MHKYLVKESKDELRIENTSDGSAVLHVKYGALSTELLEIAASTTAMPYRLIDLLRDFSFTRATDRRDKIYALLNLASDVQDVPAVDYTITEEEVFQRVASYLIGKNQGVEVLQQACQNVRDSRLSWVPTWSEVDLRTHSFYFEVDNFPEYGAGGELEPLVYLEDASPNICVARGWIVDTIVELSDVPTFTRNAEPPAKRQWCLGLVSSFMRAMVRTIKLPLSDHNGNMISYNGLDAAANDTLHQDIQQFNEVSRKLLLSRLASWANEMVKWKFSSLHEEHTNRTIRVETADAEARSMTRDPLEAMFSFLFDPSRIPHSSHTPENQRTFPYRNTVARLLHGRRLCFTTDGYMGVIPGEAAVGDKIAVLAGAKMLFVLRDAMDEEGGYLLKGDAYLRGFMQREGVSEGSLREIRLV